MLFVGFDNAFFAHYGARCFSGRRKSKKRGSMKSERCPPRHLIFSPRHDIIPLRFYFERQRNGFLAFRP